MEFFLIPWGFEGHTIHNCKEFQAEVQEMMNQGKLEFYDKEEATMNMINGGPPYPKMVKSLTIFCEKKQSQNRSLGNVTPKIIVDVTTAFPYNDDQAIP